MSTRQSPNHREVLSAISTITGYQEYLTSTSGALNTTGGGSGGGGTQYASGTSTPSPVTGNALIYDNAGTLANVSLTNALPAQLIANGDIIKDTTQYGDGVTTGILATGGRLWNGTNYDRVKSIATGIQGVGLNDGTNTANVVAGDSGYNGVATTSGTLTIPFTSSGTGAQTILANTKVEGYSTITLVLQSVGSGLAWTGQFSPTSGGTYVSYNLWQGLSAGSSGSFNAIGTTLNYMGKIHVHGNYFQLAITALTSGTVSGYIILSNSVVQETLTITGNVNLNNGANSVGTVGSNSATGSVVPANAFYVGMANSSSNLIGLSSTGTTGDSSLNGFLAAGMGLFNGTNEDRARNNITAALIAAGATTTQTQTLNTYNARSAEIIANVSAYTSGTIGLALNGVSSSGYAYPLISSITGLSATGVTVYRIGPGLTASTGFVANDMLPRTIQLVVSGTFSATYGVDYQLSV